VRVGEVAVQQRLVSRRPVARLIRQQLLQEVVHVTAATAQLGLAAAREAVCGGISCRKLAPSRHPQAHTEAVHLRPLATPRLRLLPDDLGRSVCRRERSLHSSGHG
jgi:hypothetical protein